MVSLSVIILEFQLLRTPVLLLHHQHFSCFHSKASNKISIAIHASFNPFYHNNPCTSPFSGISDISSQRCLLRDPCGPARAFIDNIRRLSLHVILWRIILGYGCFFFQQLTGAFWYSFSKPTIGRCLMVYVTSHHLKTELSNKIPAGDFSTRSLAAEDHQLNGKERVP